MKLIFIFNSILAGLGILDLHEIQQKWNVPIIIVSETQPNYEKIIKLIRDLHYEDELISVHNKKPINSIQ